MKVKIKKNNHQRITFKEIDALETMCDFAEAFKISYMLDGEDVKEGKIRKRELVLARKLIERMRKELLTSND